MSDFFEQYLAVVKLALDSGWEAHPLSASRMNANSISRSELKRFVAACHRGYEKAQNRVMEMLETLSNDRSIEEDERERRILLLRKVMDGIAATIFQDRTHLMRRLLVHDEPPNIDLKTLRQALTEANALNNESRQTFALLADLTTFIHVTDILRIDFRSASPGVSLIELKTGRVNTMLMQQLENYEPTEESLKRLAKDPAFEQLADDPETRKRYRNQAGRMLRQKIRCASVRQILATDVGRDLELQMPVVWSKEEAAVPSYDRTLNELCDNARRNGLAAGTVNHCLHLGAGFAENESAANQKAIACAKYAMEKQREDAPSGFVATVEEIAKSVPEGELFKVSNIFQNNLVALAVRPFVLWRLRREHLVSMMKGELVVQMAFDLAGFVWLCRNIGFQLEFGTGREAAEAAQKFGKQNVPTWGDRHLTYQTSHGTQMIGGGILSRFANDLTCPLAFMKMSFESEFKKPID